MTIQLAVLLAAGIAELPAQAPVRPHIFSTLVTAADVQPLLGTPELVDAAIQWLHNHSVTKIYLESYRGGTRAPADTITSARQQLETHGITVDGCMCTTKLGKVSSGWPVVSDYTNRTSQAEMSAEFARAASLFDRIIIDDFFFTDDASADSIAARETGKVTIFADEHNDLQADAVVPFHNVSDLSCDDEHPSPGLCDWEGYRTTQMLGLSLHNVLGAARKVNPNVKIILKYPNWYDSYQDKGYDTERQTQAYDEVWVGTEVRDFYDPQWGGTAAYAGYILPRWMSAVAKHFANNTVMGGGWYDTLGTSPQTYIEQARMTILGGAQESFLFNFGDLINPKSPHGPTDAAALRAHIPELLSVAAEVADRLPPLGCAAFKPPSSHGGCVQNPSAGGHTCQGESHVFDFVGMVGIPLAPTPEFPDPTQNPCAFFSIHSLKLGPAKLVESLKRYMSGGGTVTTSNEQGLGSVNGTQSAKTTTTILTDGLVAKLRVLAPTFDPTAFNTSGNVRVLAVNGSPRSLLDTPTLEIEPLRRTVLRSLGWSMDDAPIRVALFPWPDGSYVVENFWNTSVRVQVSLLGAAPTEIEVPARGWVHQWVHS